MTSHACPPVSEIARRSASPSEGRIDSRLDLVTVLCQALNKPKSTT
ncbi:hypothetical protein THTE_2179 [Thermogutta terrifontis]|uniref:Uncharacterized protein n=1 Tax=Thermogutta terrifontis TaxID=1331910 RepID=A0A286RFP1_9BACT|nr:hypothetical protein THTE_2179 [Thermogutta terrifontis]